MPISATVTSVSVHVEFRSTVVSSYTPDEIEKSTNGLCYINPIEPYEIICI